MFPFLNIGFLYSYENEMHAFCPLEKTKVFLHLTQLMQKPHCTSVSQMLTTFALLIFAIC